LIQRYPAGCEPARERHAATFAEVEFVAKELMDFIVTRVATPIVAETVG
jgi:hypothetical protein